MLIVGQRHLTRDLSEYVTHYNMVNSTWATSEFVHL